jgi:hypothetical protein
VGVGDSVTRYFRVGGRDLVYLKFILEGYDNMSVLSTVDAREGIVRLLVPAGFAADLAELIEALRQEIELTELPPETAIRE